MFAVETVNEFVVGDVETLLVPVFPAPSDWAAWAVYVVFVYSACVMDGVNVQLVAERVAEYVSARVPLLWLHEPWMPVQT